MVSARSIEDGFSDLINNRLLFDDFAMRLFRFQARENKIYRKYLNLINIEPDLIKSYQDIPCIPINFFKNHKVVSIEVQSEKIFQSSSTTGQITSKHYVLSLKHYEQNTVRIFEGQFGAIQNKIIIGLLPSYLERSDSSLVSMVDHFIKLSGDELSGFHLYDYDALLDVLRQAKSSSKQVVLFAVRYALLDLAEKYDLDLSHIKIIETGGMKGRRGPVSNQELKSFVFDKLKVTDLISEYGMTELLSQAYSDDDFIFIMSDTLRVKISDLNDPFSLVERGRSGQINVIDLANLYSCAFISTDDLGLVIDDNKFKVLGRMDHSEQRGCNLLVSDVIF